jgi:1-deoxy-D-xylulose-5-phosphate reductoisomerase
MRTPIAYALAWPERMKWPAPRLDLVQIGTLTFEAPDLERFPALGLARQALSAGGSAPTILNAANEVAVGAFLASRIGFLDIARVVESTLERVSKPSMDSLFEVQTVDCEARNFAERLIAAQ